jgi:rhodanese-related sulfurtransferase
VLIDGGENVRAPVVASWLKQLGCDVWVLEGGARAGLKGTPAPTVALPALAPISATDLRKAIDADACEVFDVGGSQRYRKSHIPGSRWSIRSRLAEDAGGAKKPVVLVADEAGVARLAATELLESGVKDIRLLDGGFAAWTKAGYPVRATPDAPADTECLDHLFFVHDRHAGNKAAMRQYLAWETGLIAQLDEQDRKAFRVGPTR